MSPERFARIKDVLATRQSDLTVLMEEVHKPHNVSAIVRTADAIGIHKVHAVWDQNPALRRGTALGSDIWVNTQLHDSTQNAVAHFKSQNMQVLVTHLDNKAVDFREIDYTLPTAIIMGQEKDGATEEAIALADHRVIVPMVGMVQSLNVSVATAIILYEAQRQRQISGAYQQSNLPENEIQEILFRGGFPKLFKECKRRGLAYPSVDKRGCIDAPESWWRDLQFTA